MLPRSAWTSAPASRGALLVAPVGVAVHWNGPPVSAAAYRGDRAAVAAYLEAVRRLHTRTNGWSDIAYQAAVDSEGRLWTLRGWRRCSAANGDVIPNRRWGAILAVLGQGQEPTDAMLDGLRDAVDLFRQVHPRALQIATHNQVRPHPTACPGPHLSRAVVTGQLEPFANREDDTMTPAELLRTKVGGPDSPTVGVALDRAESTGAKVDKLQDQVEALTKVCVRLADQLATVTELVQQGRG